MIMTSQPPLIDQDRVPPATPATPDLICWIWAAIPPRNGQINITRAADRFGVSRTTMRRWIHNAEDLELNDVAIIRARQLAILRGHGTYLWPDLDPSTTARSDSSLRYAEQAANLIADEPERIPAAWHTNGWTTPHQVLLIWWPAARVHTITTTRSDKTLSKIERFRGEIVQTRAEPNRYAAEVIKYRTLGSDPGRRCIAPNALVPIGHTEAIRHTRISKTPEVQLRKDALP